MGNLVAWAVIGGVLALLAKRGSVSVLIGTIVAIVGAVVNWSVIALLGAGLLRAVFSRPGQAPSPADNAAPELFFAAVAAVCVVAILVLRRVLVGPSPGRIRAALWQFYGAVQRGREWSDERMNDEVLGARVRARFGSRDRGLLGVRGRDRAQIPRPAPAGLLGSVAPDGRAVVAAGARAGSPGRRDGDSGGTAGSVLGADGPGGPGGGIDPELAAFEERARAFRAEMERINARV